MTTIYDPEVARLVELKPRRFQAYRECFEWTFNQEKRREKELNFIPPPASVFVERVDRLAGALFHHQNPRALA